MNIITISREFGSGGREFGKRLAEQLAVPCYDHEIIEMVAQRQGLDADYVDRLSERDLRDFYVTTIARRLAVPTALGKQSLEISAAQHQVIRELALRHDCVIVGRCADVILHDLEPLSIFVHADEASKVRRCREREAGGLSAKELRQQMRRIDRERSHCRSLYTESEWGRRESYHLCVNTSDRRISSLVPGVAAYAACWFQGREEAEDGSLAE